MTRGRGSRSEQPNEAPPTQAQTTSTPDRYKQVLDNEFGISMLMEMQRTLGALDSSVKRLIDDISDLKKDHGREIGELKLSADRFEKIFYAGVILVTVVGGLVAWGVNTAKDVALATYSASLQQTPPNPQVQPTPHTSAPTPAPAPAPLPAPAKAP